MDGHGRHCKGVGPSGSAIGFHRVCGNGAARMGNRGHGALVGVVHHANQAQEFLLLWSVASRDEKGSDLLA